MKKLDPPTHLEPEYLFNKYEPLRRAMYKKFKDKMISNADREELWSTIGEIFLQLVSEFDPNRGVDFPYYIKRMLDLRTYHHITKYIKNINREVYEENFVIEDETYEELFDRIIDLHSIDPDIELGDKHRELMVGVLIHKKTLKELADEEGVPPDRLHARLYFLIKKLKEVHEQHKEIYGEDLY
jgi:RNA polymerase sigma factor (sigma-70 family)